MSSDEFARGEIHELRLCVKKLEKSIEELNARTISLVRLGPSHGGPTTEEISAGAQRIIDAIEKNKSIPPVDRSQRTLIDGSPVPDDYSHTQDRGDGQQKNYVILTAEERAKGFVRPIRSSYLHKPCGTTTHMGRALAETYARDPEFYNGTFCCSCKKHFPLNQFVWEGTNEQVGS
jgi:hypothetical protein